MSKKTRDYIDTVISRKDRDYGNAIWRIAFEDALRTARSGRGVLACPEPVEGPRAVCGETPQLQGDDMLRNRRRKVWEVQTTRLAGTAAPHLRKILLPRDKRKRTLPQQGQTH